MLAIAQPICACKAIENAEEVAGHVVVVMRGTCLFVDKVMTCFTRQRSQQPCLRCDVSVVVMMVLLVVVTTFIISIHISLSLFWMVNV